MRGQSLIVLTEGWFLLRLHSEGVRCGYLGLHAGCGQSFSFLLMILLSSIRKDISQIIGLYAAFVV